MYGDSAVYYMGGSHNCCEDSRIISFDSVRKKEFPVQKKILFFAAVFLAVFCISILVGGYPANAGEGAGKSAAAHKYYKSIEVVSGDTLWGIAEQYNYEKYSSIQEYIEEIKQINGLLSDEIQSGQYITIAYYED